MSEKAKDTVVVRLSDSGKLALDRGGSSLIFPESSDPELFPHLYALTPLREGEPKPREVWTTYMGTRVEILSAPVGEERRCVVRWSDGEESSLNASDLRPIPPEPEHREWCGGGCDGTCERRNFHQWHGTLGKGGYIYFRPADERGPERYVRDERGGDNGD